MSDTPAAAKPPGKRIHTVRPCPICRCTHVGLTFIELRNPLPDGSSHFAICPVEGKRLLLTLHKPAQNKGRGQR